MLDVRRLRVLAEVAKRGSFTAAADALSYTPSAVSQQIAALEREAGVRLVDRSARGVRLTEPGRLLAHQAGIVLLQLETAEQELQALAGLRSGLLRLGWFATAGGTIMPRAIAEFGRMHPDIDLDLYQGDPDDCVQKLRAGELELALVYEFELAPPLAPDVEQVFLLDDPLYVGLPLDHPLAVRDRIDLADLAGQRWIQGVLHGSTIEVLPRACRLAGFEPDIAFRTDDRTAVEGLVAAGVGIALVPRLTVPTARRDIALVPLLGGGLRRRVLAALPPSTYRPPAASAMLGVLQRLSTQLLAETTRRLDRTRSTGSRPRGGL